VSATDGQTFEYACSEVHEMLKPISIDYASAEAFIKDLVESVRRRRPDDEPGIFRSKARSIASSITP
jgi:hypothetical protein